MDLENNQYLNEAALSIRNLLESVSNARLAWFDSRLELEGEEQLHSEKMDSLQNELRNLPSTFINSANTLGMASLGTGIDDLIPLVEAFGQLALSCVEISRQISQVWKKCRNQSDELTNKEVKEFGDAMDTLCVQMQNSAIKGWSVLSKGSLRIAREIMSLPPLITIEQHPKVKSKVILRRGKLQSITTENIGIILQDLSYLPQVSADARQVEGKKDEPNHSFLYKSMDELDYSGFIVRAKGFPREGNKYTYTAPFLMGRVDRVDGDKQEPTLFEGTEETAL